MEVLKPAPLNTEYAFGTNSNGHLAVMEWVVCEKRPDIPAVLRDKRGRVKWSLLGNTPEENELLGIRNIQSLFLARFPEFIEMFLVDEHNKDANVKREVVKRFIIEKAGSQKKFDSIFGSSPHAKHAVPYFEGSHLVALQKSFSIWGDDLIDREVFSEESQRVEQTPNELKRVSLRLPIDWHGRSILHRSRMTKQEIVAAIESEAVQFIQNGGHLTETAFRKAGLRRLISIISQHYDGGIEQLKRNLGWYRSIVSRIVSDETYQLEQDTLGVVRYNSGQHKGKTCWHLPDKTEEENLHIGINNVRALFLARFPEFIEMFPRGESGIIEETKKREARRFILERIGDLKNFRRLISSVVNNLSYFDGSHLVALQKSFEQLGIDFFDIDIHDISSIPRDPRGRFIWHIRGRRDDRENNTKQAIKIMQAIFLNKYPEFERLFPRGEDEQVDKNIEQKAAKYILERCGDRSKFLDVFSNSPVSRDVIPEFNGSFIEALRRSFESWGISFKIRDFRAERIWRGKTKEEILTIVRTIFLEKYPEFAEIFLSDSKSTISFEKIAEAERFILNKLFSRIEFQKLFGGVSSKDPSLQNSYQMVMQEAFSFWGLFKTSTPKGTKVLEDATLGALRSRESKNETQLNLNQAQQLFLSLPWEKVEEVGKKYIAYARNHPDCPMDIVEFYAREYLTRGGN